MIDSIKFMTTHFSINDYGIFLNEKGNKVSKEELDCGNLNLHLKPMEDGIYRPKINLVCDYYGKKQIYVEFSAPKLLYGNNLTELKESDCADVVTRLVLVLGDLGIRIFRKDIENAISKKLHLSKNFIVPENTTCADAINIFKTAKYPHMELEEIEKDKCIKFYSDDFAIVIYDKVGEMKFHNSFDELPENVKVLPEIEQHRILRIEVQMKEYSIKNKIVNDILETNGNLKFKQAFNEEIFKEIFERILKKLNETIPDMVLEGKEIEELNEICDTPGELSKKFLLISYQKQQGNYFDGIKKLRKDFDLKNNFIEANNCILIKDEYFRDLAIKCLKEIQNYEPLNYQFE